MSHVPHELADEFPQDAALLHALKLGDAHFQTLAERYHEVNRAIHRADSGIEPAADEHVEQLKKQRLGLLDEVGTMLAKVRPAA